MELYLEVLIQKQDFQLLLKGRRFLRIISYASWLLFYAGLGYNQLKEYRKQKPF